MENRVAYKKLCILCAGDVPKLYLRIVTKKIAALELSSKSFQMGE